MTEDGRVARVDRDILLVNPIPIERVRRGVIEICAIVFINDAERRSR
jgi:hypothetical protein